MFLPATNVWRSSRLQVLPRPGERITALEVTVLVACGALAAVAVATLASPIRVPGHAILRAVFPMAAGLALVPRRGAGATMAVGAVLGALTLRLGGYGVIQPAAMMGLVALGPAIDLAMARAPGGWRLYLRLAAAGAAVNVLAWVVRFAFAATVVSAGRGGGAGAGHDFYDFWPAALASYALCGAVAGLVSGAAWFRLKPGNAA